MNRSKNKGFTLVSLGLMIAHLDPVKSKNWKDAAAASWKNPIIRQRRVEAHIRLWMKRRNSSMRFCVDEKTFYVKSGKSAQLISKILSDSDVDYKTVTADEPLVRMKIQLTNGIFDWVYVISGEKELASLLSSLDIVKSVTIEEFKHH